MASGCPSNGNWTNTRCHTPDAVTAHTNSGSTTLCGPLEGGTKFTIEGVDLGCYGAHRPGARVRNTNSGRLKAAQLTGHLYGTDANGTDVTVATYVQTDWTRLECVSEPQSGALTTRMRFDRHELVCEDDRRNLSRAAVVLPAFTFQRVAVTGFSPRYGLKSGGARIRVTGVGLNVTGDVHVDVKGRACAVVEGAAEFDAITCVLGGEKKEGVQGKTKNYVQIDSLSQKLDAGFKLMPEPELDSKTDSKTVLKTIMRFVLCCCVFVQPLCSATQWRTRELFGVAVLPLSIK